MADQVKRMKALGQVEELRDDLEGNFVPPTIARIETNCDEEVFGPAAILKKFKAAEEAINLANETPFGLGASIWGDPASAEKLVPHIDAGFVFINKIVASDPRLQFRGVKKSWIECELSRYDLLEFTSKRTVWVN